MLGSSEHMLWIQSMSRVPYAYLQMPIGWIWLVMPIIVYVHIHLGIGYLRPGVLGRTLFSDMIKIELTNIPVKSGIVYADVDCLHLWSLFVDDTFVIQQQPHKQLFLDHINNIDPAIRSTVEGSQGNGSIPFLDTLVKPEADMMNKIW